MILNSTYLRNRITELGIKQWWLADQVGVDRKTVSRWIQGKSRAIQVENVKALAEVLNCQVGDLCHADEASQLGTADDQRTAAMLLQTSSLVDKLGPIGEWDVIESLLRATIIPNLPLHVLGDLYNQLTVASWRQSKLEQARAFNAKAFEIANRLGDNAILASALLSQANLLSWAGKLQESIQTLHRCLSLQEHFSAKMLGSIYSNIGAVLLDCGDFDAALKFEISALDQFLIHGTPMNLSIAYTNLVFIYLEQEKTDLAAAANLRAEEHARTSSYQRGVAMAKLCDGEILAIRGQFAQAQDAARMGLDLFSKLGITEGLNFLFAARIFRRSSDHPKALDFIAKGISAAERFPLELARLYQEQAVIAELSSNSGLLESAVVAARDLFRNCSAPLRLLRLEKQFSAYLKG